MDLRGYHRPKELEDVSQLLAQSGTLPLAGGTDLLVRMKGGALLPSDVIDLNLLPFLGEIRQTPDGGIEIGATVRMSRVMHDPACCGYPVLVEGASTVGSMQIRNRATVVGNVCNASPAADTAPGLLVYGAEVNVVAPGGSRSVPIGEFWIGAGQTVLEEAEWVESITLPPPENHGGCYLKLGRTLGTDLAITGVGMLVTPDDTRVALASVAPTPIRARTVEAFLRTIASGESLDGLDEAVSADISPIDDLRASARYRQAMTAVLIKRAWLLAKARLIGGRRSDR